MIIFKLPELSHLDFRFNKIGPLNKTNKTNVLILMSVIWYDATRKINYYGHYDTPITSIHTDSIIFVILRPLKKVHKPQSMMNNREEDLRCKAADIMDDRCYRGTVFNREAEDRVPKFSPDGEWWCS
jgi:hypothetical protein